MFVCAQCGRPAQVLHEGGGPPEGHAAVCRLASDRVHRCAPPRAPPLGPLAAEPIADTAVGARLGPAGADIVFSWDNVAAVFSCSTNMPLVWAATMLAVISLRAWYHVVATAVSDMPALQTATGGILMFLGAKLLLEYFMPALRISTYATLAVIAGSLGAAIAVSVLGNSRRGHVPKSADT